MTTNNDVVKALRAVGLAQTRAAAIIMERIADILAIQAPDVSVLRVCVDSGDRDCFDMKDSDRARMPHGAWIDIKRLGRWWVDWCGAQEPDLPYATIIGNDLVIDVGLRSRCGENSETSQGEHSETSQGGASVD